MPITVPEKVKVEVKDKTVSVEGPKGKLQYSVPGRITPNFENNVLTVTRDGDDAETKALHGLSRALLNNLVIGVSEGYSRKLEIHGVGFKAELKGKTLTLNLGYSHPCVYDLPELVTVAVQDQTKLTVEGPDKHLVGKVASELRAFYPPEPYKGKGVRYADEKIIRKEGKKVQ